MTYVLIRSWHSVAMTYRGGAVRTRCGRGPLTVEGTLAGGSERIHPTTDDLPVNDKTCNRCFALDINDRELDAEPR